MQRLPNNPQAAPAKYDASDFGKGLTDAVDYGADLYSTISSNMAKNRADFKNSPEQHVLDVLERSFPILGSLDNVDVTTGSNGTQVTGLDEASQLAAENAGDLIGGGLAAPVKAFHASPHAFSKFDNAFFGKGEGNAMMGEGFYSYTNPKVHGQYDDLWQRQKGLQRDFSQLTAPKSQGGEGMSFDAAMDYARERMKSLEKLKSDDSILGRMVRDTEPTAEEMSAFVSELERTGNTGRNFYELELKPDTEDYLNLSQQVGDQKNLYDKLRKSNFPVFMENYQRGGSIKRELVPLGDFTRRHQRSQAMAIPHELERQFRDGPVTSQIEALGSILGTDRYGTIRMSPKTVSSKVLQDAGLPGIRFDDGFSRGKGLLDPTQNYVTFDADDIKIMNHKRLAHDEFAWWKNNVAPR